MDEVKYLIGGFFNNSFYYTDTDFLYMHKNYWSSLVDNGFFGISLRLGKNDYGKSGIYYAWFLAPNIKIKYCLVIDDFGVNSANRTFKGYSEKHKLINLDEYISLSEAETVPGRFSIDWTKTFEGIKIPHRKQACSDCDSGKNCRHCALKSKTKCFSCEMVRSCKTCLDLISQKKHILLILTS